MATHTITATERRFAGPVRASFAIATAATVALAIIARPQGPFAWAAIAAAAALLIYLGLFIAQGRTSVGMLPLLVVALGFAGASARIWPLAAAGAAVALALAAFFLRMHAAYARRPIPNDLAAVIVLGCAVRQGRPSPTLARRLDAALALAAEHPDAVFVVTGGLGQDGATEASVMRSYLLDRGIPPARIIADEHALNTEENIANALALLDRAGVAGPVAVVSSDYHLLRTLGIARGLGRDLIGVPARTTPQTWLIQWAREALVICEWTLRRRAR